MTQQEFTESLEEALSWIRSIQKRLKATDNTHGPRHALEARLRETEVRVLLLQMELCDYFSNAGIGYTFSVSDSVMFVSLTTSHHCCDYQLGNIVWRQIMF